MLSSISCSLYIFNHFYFHHFINVFVYNVFLSHLQKKELPSVKSETIWSHVLVRSRDKLTMLILHYHNDYGYQLWQGDSIQWKASCNKVTKSLNHVVLQGQVANRNVIYLLLQDLMSLNLAKWWVKIRGFHQ